MKKYLKAGRKGDSEAYNCSGLMIEELNPIEAVEMYKKAIAIDGNSDSMFNMALLYYTNKDEAEWHKEAI